MKAFQPGIVLLLAILFSSFNIQAQEKEKSTKPGKEYVVYEKNRDVTRLEIRRNAKFTENVVEIETRNITGGTALIEGNVPTAEITSMEAVVGSYGTKIEISRTGRSVILRLSDVVYPLRLRLTISQRPVVEFELKEPGSWNVVAGVSL